MDEKLYIIMEAVEVRSQDEDLGGLFVDEDGLDEEGWREAIASARSAARDAIMSGAEAEEAYAAYAAAMMR